MKILVLVFISMLLSACGAGQFGSSYRAYMDPRLNPDVQPLSEGQEAIIIRSNDLDKDVTLYREHNYLVVGESAFNGIIEGEGRAKKQAEEVGATHVIISSEYTDTKSYLAYDYQNHYRTIYVNKVKNVDGKAVHYREAVTIRDTVAVPYTRVYDNYDQWAVYFVKSLRLRKLGLIMRDLSPDERQNMNRNTGAFIDLVLSNSPAFLADIMTGDALLAINGVKIDNAMHAESIIEGLSLGGETIVLNVFKDGVAKDVTFEFND